MSQNSDVIFLFGSGTSLPSGLQSVSEITESIFTENYFVHTDQSVIKGVHPSEYLRQHYDLKPLQDFLRLLHEKSNLYLNEKLGPQFSSSYEDLYFIVDQIAEERVGNSDNLIIKPFIENLKELSFGFRNAYKRDYSKPPITLGKFCDKCKVLVETVVKYGIWDKEPVGLQQLVNLAQENTSTIDIFTLNHDTLLEKLFRDNSTGFSDGFGELDGEVRWYSPNEYDTDQSVNIYHLHGSRNWSWVRNKNEDKYAILTGKDKWHTETADGSDVMLLFDKGNLLTGANKSSRYHFGIFGDLFYRFNSRLRNCSRIIISGYGWNDYGMNRLILEWLWDKPDNKLLVIHKKPDALIYNSRFLTRRTFETDKIEILEKWFEEIESDELYNFFKQ